MSEFSLGAVSEVSPRDYVDPEVLAREQQHIFARHWQFVGFADELARHNDFVTAEIAGRSILVQNFDGILRGFHNVCAHRHARIHSAPCGNRFLQCPYHGWAYNADGVPVGIPGNAQYFGLDSVARQRLALKPVAVASHGGFVFARLSTEGPELASALGGYGEAIEEISRNFTDPIADCTVLWTANWKLAVESAVEVYHAGMIHPETFAKVTPNSPVFEGGFDGAHSFGHLAMAADGAAWWERVGQRLKLARLKRFSDYDHYHLFPNLMIALSHGSLMCLQTYEPIDVTSCRLRYRLRLARAEGPQNPAVRKAVIDTLCDFNRRVVEEDVAITTEVQHGVAQATRPAMLGNNERRLAHFQARYLAEMAR
jgi:choline monooxygenase